MALATLSEQDGHWLEMLPLLRRALQQSEAVEDHRNHATLQMHLGVFSRLLAEYPQARIHLQAACEEFAALADRPKLAYCTFRRAPLERMAGQLEAAQRFAEEGLALFAEDDPGRGGCFTVLGTVAYERYQWQEAEHFFRMALQERLKGNDLRGLAWAYADLGWALQGQKRYGEAIACYREAMSLIERLHAAAEKAVFQLNLSAIYLTMEDAQPALELCLACAPIFRHNRDVRRLMMAATNLGIAYRYLQEWEQGEAALAEAIELARRWGFQQAFVNALDQLGLLYVKAGRTEEAIATFDRAVRHLEEIPNAAAREWLQTELAAHRAEAEKAITIG
jgi:tetratricopeptide (TPR) repeat protein